MTEPFRPLDHVYVLKLNQAHPGRPGPSGRLEHVGSGRRHDFHDGASLLECIAREEARAAQDAEAAALVRPIPEVPDEQLR
ncbi:hypothetical protein [Piscinibacter gummiphilus]|uniref:Uncharacterized protein n=1 Tax=Piscinibacter gummiphilus TaxID=946333 RepID=A0A1W6L3Y2_9BURK|nr:hypothetical protein [Piscinibacter gummiphilus]ARN19019.1 hypothetical protein A4W93_03285 [Piscinibacter gummiphilus]ATU63664.1 hypothetical protein CPZ87_03360 [Piscinibacter gummiphilus]GLS93408.1 hypothetical protein GCM10007918_06990 [Piscinibacter gummiphilus]